MVIIFYDDFLGMSSSLRKLINLQYLDLSYNSISLEHKLQRKQFSECLEHLKKIEIISLSYNRINDAGWALLFSTFKPETHSNLKIFDLSHSFLTVKSVPLILSFITSSPIQLLNLSGLILSIFIFLYFNLYCLLLLLLLLLF